MKKVKLPLKHNKLLRSIIFFICLIVFAFSGIKLINRAVDYYNTKKLNNNLLKIQQHIDTIQATDSENNNEENNFFDTRDSIKELEWRNLDYMFLPNGMDSVRATERENLQYLFQMSGNAKDEALKRINEAVAERKRIDEENKVQEIKNQIQKLKKINGDIKGWVRIDNTRISNPIVQTVDNSFYLEHDVSKSENSYGTIFIDSNNDVSSPKKFQGQNIILYGHHMKDGTMFGDLAKFRDNDFFKNNDTIKLDIFPNSYKFKIFGVYVVDQDFDYRNTKLGSKDDINSLMSRLRSKCYNDRNVSLNANDTVLTLSTCDYDFENARLVLMAKLVTE